MLTEWELWAVADTVIRRHGDGVAAYVAERIAALALAGDSGGVTAWRQIEDRIAKLTAAPPVRPDA